MECRIKERYEVIPISVNEAHTAASVGWAGEFVYFNKTDKAAALRKETYGFIVKIHDSLIFYNAADFNKTFEIIEE